MTTGLGAADEGVKEVMADNDPWKHRSKLMMCKNCMWFVFKEAKVSTKIGRCRRHSPTMNGYPVVFDTDWCGDHKVDENKV